MNSKAKRKLARETHLRQKYKAKYMRIFRKHGAYTWLGVTTNAFDALDKVLNDLEHLNVKHLSVLLNELESGTFQPYGRESNRKLIDTINSFILEKTILK